MNTILDKPISNWSIGIASISIIASVGLAAWAILQASLAIRNDMKVDINRMEDRFVQQMAESDKHWREMFTHMNNRIDGTIKKEG